jgi:hypothetical protein
MSNGNAAMNFEPRPVTSLGDMIANQQIRAVYRFKIPEVYHTYGVKEVGLVELTASEEIMAVKRAGTSQAQLAYELAKESLREVDGKPIATMDGTADVAFEKVHPKVRTLICTAYGSLHNPGDNETKDFLMSRELRVG